MATKVQLSEITIFCLFLSSTNYETHLKSLTLAVFAMFSMIYQDFLRFLSSTRAVTNNNK